jgi:N-acetylglucosamine kinase-like BadF-type ATPase
MIAERLLGRRRREILQASAAAIIRDDPHQIVAFIRHGKLRNVSENAQRVMQLCI